MTDREPFTKEIVGKLEKTLAAPQREILTYGTGREEFPAYHWAMIAGYNATGGRLAHWLKGSGLFSSRMGGAQVLLYRLNDLGLAVRHLITQGEGEKR